MVIFSFLKYLFCSHKNMTDKFEYRYYTVNGNKLYGKYQIVKCEYCGKLVNTSIVKEGFTRKQLMSYYKLSVNEINNIIEKDF